MKRYLLFRVFVLVAALGASVGAGAATRTVHIGFLRAEAPDALFTSFRDGMHDLGYVEGRNLVIEQRWAYGKYGELPRLARELVDLKVEVIFASCTPCTQAALQATQTIPIVTLSGDPVAMGFVASLSRPGGNVTGLTLMLDQMSVKRLEILKEMVPGISAVAVLWAVENPFWERSGIIARMTRAALALGIHADVVKVRGRERIDDVLVAPVNRQAYALYIFEEPLLRDKSAQILTFAAKHQIPAMYGGSDFVRNGGLISYGPSLDDLFRRAASYVAQILNGASPAELPLQQPTKYELVVNLKTAKAIGLSIPQAILLRADEVIR